jgi:nicotinate-nucleotide pyrophosphorylase (carboxylating)
MTGAATSPMTARAAGAVGAGGVTADPMTAPLAADPADLARIIAAALAEDLGPGDVTSEALINPNLRCRTRVLLKEPGVVAGLAAVEATFAAVAALATDVTVRPAFADGARVAESPVVLAEIEGLLRVVLAGERTALNLLGRLSGIATLTRAYVDAIAGTGAVILDTRKTTPGLRALEKYAVRCGGGTNHRLGLYDAVLIKDNHLRAAGGVGPAVARARAAAPGLQIEVETETLAEVREALAADADRILLDNMLPPLMRRAVDLVAGRIPLEASGGVTLATVRSIAETGVMFISVGALTHGARSLDVSLEVLS